MPTSTTLKTESAGALYPGATDNSSPVRGVQVAAPGNNVELVRCQATVEVSVVTFSYGSASRPLDVNWWPFTFPVFGILWDETELVPGTAPLPISAGFADNWIINDGMSGFVDFLGVDVNGNEQLTYKWNTSPTVETSVKKRKPTFPSVPLQLLLCVEFIDPLLLINRTSSFPQAYDLYVSWNVRAWWKEPPF